jgi:hypothetical protein
MASSLGWRGGRLDGRGKGALSLAKAQQYVLRELRIGYERTSDTDARGRIVLLERAFRGPASDAVNREPDVLRPNEIMGETLVRNLTRIHQQHNTREWLDRVRQTDAEQSIPRIACSEALV